MRPRRSRIQRRLEFTETRAHSRVHRQVALHGHGPITPARRDLALLSAIGTSILGSQERHLESVSPAAARTGGDDAHYPARVLSRADRAHDTRVWCEEVS